MGLANFKYIDEIIRKRKVISEIYDDGLKLQRPQAQKDLKYNYAYYPVVCKTHKQSQNIAAALEKNNIKVRRYF